TGHVAASSGSLRHRTGHGLFATSPPTVLSKRIAVLAATTRSGQAWRTSSPGRPTSVATSPTGDTGIRAAGTPAVVSRGGGADLIRVRPDLFTRHPACAQPALVGSPGHWPAGRGARGQLRGRGRRR